MSLARRACAAAAYAALGANALFFHSSGRTAHCAPQPPPLALPRERPGPGAGSRAHVAARSPPLKLLSESPSPGPGAGSHAHVAARPPQLQLLSESPAPGPGTFHLKVVAPEGVRTAFHLFCANAAVWGAWQLRSATVQRFLNEWFMTRGGAQQGSLPSALTRSLLSSYSHSSLLHLGCNMMGLLSFAPRCMDGRESLRAPKLSQGEFLTMYTLAGVAAALGSTAFSSRYGTARPGLGASGSIFAVLTYAVAAYPDSRVLIFFFFEASAEHALLAGTALNLYMAAKEVQAARGRAGPPLMDGMAHLIGSAVGYAAYLWAAERAKGRRSASALVRRSPPRRGADTLDIPMPPGGATPV